MTACMSLIEDQKNFRKVFDDRVKFEEEEERKIKKKFYARNHNFSKFLSKNHAQQIFEKSRSNND